MSERDEKPSNESGSPLALRSVDLQVGLSRSLSVEPARPIVVVLGMHRSGTSLLSNVLHVLGVDMADTTDRVSPKNAGGFWERPALVEIHDEILAAIGRPIAKPSHILPFPPAWWRSKEVQALKPKLIAYLREQLGKSSNPWGFKDPRTCRLLPLWGEIFRELNLEPIFVTAIRTPSESSVSMSAKSAQRRLSVGNSELMWLSYNYDIARHVIVKSPAIVVDYEEWFKDPSEIAQRLTSSLGIGRDMSPEDVSESLNAIIRGEYRHQVDGRDGVASNVPLAAMLYKAMTAHQPLASSDNRTLRSQIQLVNLFFKSIASAVRDMDDAVLARSTAEAERDELSKAKSDTEQALHEVETAINRVRSERDSATEQMKRAFDEREVQTARLTAIEAENEKLESELAAARAEAGAGAEKIAEIQAVNSRLEAKLAAARAEAGAGTEKIAEIQAENSRLEAKLAAVRAEAGAGAEKIAAIQAENSKVESELAAARAEAEAGAEKIAAIQAENSRLEAELVTAQADAQAADIAAKGARADAQAALENAEKAASLAAAQNEMANAKLQSQRQRSRNILQRAKQWRDEYLAEQGEPSARLESAVQAAELRKSIMKFERRLAVAEERNRRFAAELEARDKTLAAMALERAERPLPAAPEPVFFWPGDEAGKLGAEGGIDCADANGIRGHVSFANRTDIVPVIEVRVNGLLVHAQTCLANDDGQGPKDGKWPFFVPWHCLSQENTGAEAVVMVSGLDLELGKASIPADLASYHLSPALKAAKSVGGSVAEAAEYRRWLREHEPSNEVELAREYRSASTHDWPRITVLIHGAERDDLILTLESLRAQTYGQWQAVFIGGPSELAELDPRFISISPTQLDDVLELASNDDLVSFIEAGDIISPTALLHLANAAVRSPGFALIYSDEDWFDPRSGLRALPYMKGEWSLDLALAQDFTSRLAMVRRDMLGSAMQTLDAAGVYGLTVKAGMAGNGSVIHLPFVLYHRSVNQLQPELSATVQAILDNTTELAKAEAIKDDEGRRKIIWPMPDPLPKVSLIVPTRDRVDLLRVCVDGFLHETRYDNLEILIADNDSREDETKAYLAKVATHPRVRVIPCPGPFNYSTINNRAVSQSHGSVIGLMNNDLKVLDPDWLRAMVAHAVRPDVGIVGAKLLHGDGTIQHAGVTLGIGVASHLYKSFAGGAEGHHGRLVLPQDLSAVTAACLLIRRDVWEQLGGLDDEFPVAYNDIDLCLRARAAGFRVVWTPDALVYHLESQSRGKEDTPEKRERLDLDKARMTERWGDLLSTDPFHSPNLSNRHVDARLAFPSRAIAPWLSMPPSKQ